MPGRRFAQVALPLPVDHPFTYSVPEALLHRAAIGMRALVPVGRRLETGYIVGLADECEIEKVRDLSALPDDTPALSDEIIRLCTWIADYYCCSLGEVLPCAVPSGINQRTRKHYRLAPALPDGRYTERQREVVALLHARGPLAETDLAEALGKEDLAPALAALERRGAVLSEAVAQRATVSASSEAWAVLIEAAAAPIAEQVALQRRAPKQAAVYFDLLRNDPEQPAAALCARHGATTAALKALEEKGLIRREAREVYRTPMFHADAAAREKLPLNSEQQAAHDAIAAALDAGKFQTFLMHGITGSGKTEVYLQVIERALTLGKSAIVLVPEISLTPQTVGRFLARFQTDIAVLHSGLGQGERYDEWRRAQRGEVRIVVGARSAVFAPLKDLGILIVDEEHDSSYKQSEVPRYHARDAAIMRAQMCGAACILGSATPSIESYYNSEAGKSLRLDLKRRATRSALPTVKLVDMRVEMRESGGEVVLARELEEALAARLAEREQVILLLNRRGHTPYLLCPACSTCAVCTECHVTMTYHARGQYLSCHYCNARRLVPQACDDCGFSPLTYLGQGTQKLEDYLLRAFPNARIERMDRDTTSSKHGHAKILQRFAKREIDILAGTQMIAKGHDYPGVTLVGVLNADAGLALPDFRAAENVFQLLTQVAGRAGRGDLPGEVLIQTCRPTHFAIQAAKNHDYAAFYAREIADRQRSGYPPFRRMVQFTIESEDANEAERAAMRLNGQAREAIETLSLRGIELLGPAPATIHRVKNKYRWNLGAFSRSAKTLNALARALRNSFQEQSNKSVSLKSDLDPYGLF
jgi:primosomal protein N' (replication factor Y)